MTIYDKAKIKCRTFIESINILFNMGKDLETEVNGKQATLVSGTNIKTINGGSVLGEGNLVVVGDAPAVESGDAGKALVVNAGETGAEWSTGIKVATTPAAPTNAVNSVYVNDATEGVNNIVHKTGNEIISGTKTFTSDVVKSSTADITITPTDYINMATISIVDKNNVNSALIRRDRLVGDVDRLFLSINKPVGSDTYGIRFDLSIDSSGVCTLAVNKQKNGSTVSTQQLWSE